MLDTTFTISTLEEYKKIFTCSTYSDMLDYYGNIKNDIQELEKLVADLEPKSKPEKYQYCVDYFNYKISNIIILHHYISNDFKLLWNDIKSLCRTNDKDNIELIIKEIKDIMNMFVVNDDLYYMYVSTKHIMYVNTSKKNLNHVIKDNFEMLGENLYLSYFQEYKKYILNNLKISESFLTNYLDLLNNSTVPVPALEDLINNGIKSTNAYDVALQLMGLYLTYNESKYSPIWDDKVRDDKVRFFTANPYSGNSSFVRAVIYINNKPLIDTEGYAFLDYIYTDLSQSDKKQFTELYKCTSIDNDNTYCEDNMSKLNFDLHDSDYDFLKRYCGQDVHYVDYYFSNILHFAKYVVSLPTVE